ncbi:uncharacterized protein N7498_004669 [Penicillium cinerascens]|uniref:Uncharacterized protein n=1 Tax=Penicillium cinerascens TaxID=70096 RepID=A0A9W9MLZ3_9EURO|nr:uncharacterized protein N7498_004669 [Penicillium cinerascens]KAJ5203790.1 hypothetical protein N7498_004669 [Penicillium cinerascens]
MKFSLISLVALASVLSPDTASAQPLDKRGGSVVLTAYYDNQIVIGGGGPGQSTVNTMRTWFEISVDGERPREIAGNSISGKWQVIQSSKTKTPMNISYKANFMIGSFRGCTASYNGRETAGTPMSAGGHAGGQVSAKCVMKFGL